MSGTFGFGPRNGRRRLRGGPLPPPPPSPTPTPTPTPTMPLRVISTQNRINSGKESRATRTGCCIRWPIVLGTDASDLIVSIPNWYQMGSGAGETATGNGFTIEEMVIENAGGAISTPVRFAGGRSVTVADNANDLQSDAVLPAAFTLPQFSRGEQYWVKGRITLALGTHALPYSDRNRSSIGGSQVNWYDPAATTPSSTDIPGPYTATGTAFDIRNNGFCPIILGHPAVDGPSFIGIGDSIMCITADTGGGTSVINGVGFFHRAMHDAASTAASLRPSLNFARVGAATAHYTAAGNTRWRQYVRYVRFAVEELGTNNLGTSSAGNAASLQAEIAALWTLLRAGGVQKIARTRMIPRTASSDSWATIAGQSPFPAFVAGGTAEAVNTWFESKRSDGTIDAVVAMASTHDTSVPQAWPVNGTAFYACTDGTHPKDVIHEAMAAELRAAIAGW